MNANPRIGVLLKIYGASVRLSNVFYRLEFQRKGLKWLQKNWPEERMRKELIGYGPGTSGEWNNLLAKRAKLKRDIDEGYF